jgi:hypothetical protein
VSEGLEVVGVSEGVEVVGVLDGAQVVGVRVVGCFVGERVVGTAVMKLAIHSNVFWSAQLSSKKTGPPEAEPIYARTKFESVVQQLQLFVLSDGL